MTFYRLQKGKKILGSSAHHAEWAEGPMWQVPACREAEALNWIDLNLPSEGYCYFCHAPRIRVTSTQNFPQFACPHLPPCERVEVLIIYCRLHPGVDATETPEELIRLMHEWDLLYEVDDALELDPALQEMWVLELEGRVVERVSDGVVVAEPRVIKRTRADRWVRAWARKSKIHIL